MVGLSVYILADTFFIASWLVAGGLAALNIALQVFSVINGLALMLGMGGGARFMLRKSCGKAAANTAKPVRSLRGQSASRQASQDLSCCGGLYGRRRSHPSSVRMRRPSA